MTSVTSVMWLNCMRGLPNIVPVSGFDEVASRAAEAIVWGIPFEGKTLLETLQSVTMTPQLRALLGALPRLLPFDFSEEVLANKPITKQVFMERILRGRQDLNTRRQFLPRYVSRVLGLGQSVHFHPVWTVSGDIEIVCPETESEWAWISISTIDDRNNDDDGMQVDDGDGENDLVWVVAHLDPTFINDIHDKWEFLHEHGLLDAVLAGDDFLVYTLESLG